MYRRLHFIDNKLTHAVINCDFAAVKQILDSGDYDKEGLKDIRFFHLTIIVEL